MSKWASGRQWLYQRSAVIQPTRPCGCGPVVLIADELVILLFGRSLPNKRELLRWTELVVRKFFLLLLYLFCHFVLILVLGRK